MYTKLITTDYLNTYIFKKTYQFKNVCKNDVMILILYNRKNYFGNSRWGYLYGVLTS